ncbi:DUF1360 domain-containing protein [Streptomyces sp. TRM 70361]|uniref:DUF1360 domain-containing protein n=1 Tax=Streptomyces sp. TRM 70361 TaxID=3116553 RepID=UPI002E7B47F1|nr:DUF1360 domain-containing protein [Streptomyces sp. TRM 70361]MEE1940251.1 DUF1360 domain-containing protein [Streptomyces sp. TRM 70361]
MSGAMDQAAETVGRATGADEYSEGGEVSLRGLVTLAGVYASGIGVFAWRTRASGRQLPERVPPLDLLLMGVATYRSSRLLTKDKVTSFLRAPFTRRAGSLHGAEVMDEPRGHGLHRSVGELLACPFCVAMWVASGLTMGYVAAPRATRLVVSCLSTVAFSDWLQYAWSLTQQKAED